MTHHIVFNGDADGLCALQQLLLDSPGPALLTTGTKRTIDLVRQVKAVAGDIVTVLDLSLHSNRPAVDALLNAGVRVRYFDHHTPGDPPDHPALELHIDTSPTLCTSLIVNRHLNGRWRRWAAAGAFGDNLEEAGLAAAGDLPPAELDILRELGMSLNYNAYGPSERDLFIPPAELHRRLIAYRDPLEFAARSPLFGELSDRLRADLDRAEQTEPLAASSAAAVYLLPASDWSLRVSGLWAHRLFDRFPQRAHAVVTHKPEGGHVVSVRAPKSRPWGAGAFCGEFPGGGGRESAAGINHLPEEDLEAFCERFLRQFSS